MFSEHIRPLAKTWKNDRTKTVGASEIGACAKQVWYRKRNQPEEREFGWGFGERGNNVEDWAFKALARAGFRFVQRQKTLSSRYLSATLDGKRAHILLDVKSFDPWKKTVVEPKHIMQVQCQIGLWNDTQKHSVTLGLLWYINASNYEDNREHIVEPDPAAYAAAHERAKYIMTTAEPPPREGVLAGGKECEWCPFQTACLGAPIEDRGKLSEADTEALSAAREEIHAREIALKKQERGITAAKERIREILARRRRPPGAWARTNLPVTADDAGPGGNGTGRDRSRPVSETRSRDRNGVGRMTDLFAILRKSKQETEPMSTDLATFNESALAAFQNAASALSGGDQKPILKFLKGDWYVGQDNEEVRLGTKVAADMMHAEWGWVRWHNNKPVDRRMVVIASGATMADREDLGHDDQQLWERDEKSGQPRDPWTKAIEIPVRELTGGKREFTLAGSSMGFQGAFKRFLKDFGEGMRANAGKAPIIELGADKYDHSKYGLTKVPALGLAGWFDPDAPAVVKKGKF